jgi:hypothetical protein
MAGETPCFVFDGHKSNHTFTIIRVDSVRKTAPEKQTEAEGSNVIGNDPLGDINGRGLNLKLGLSLHWKGNC